MGEQTARPYPVAKKVHRRNCGFSGEGEMDTVGVLILKQSGEQ